MSHRSVSLRQADQRSYYKGPDCGRLLEEEGWLADQARVEWQTVDDGQGGGLMPKCGSEDKVREARRDSRNFFCSVFEQSPSDNSGDVSRRHQLVGGRRLQHPEDTVHAICYAMRYRHGRGTKEHAMHDLGKGI